MYYDHVKHVIFIIGLVCSEVYFFLYFALINVL